MNSKPIHILLVEDDDAHAELIQLAMEENRVANTIDRVADGRAAMQYVRGQPPYQDKPRPDLILLDLKLPYMSGHEVLRAIKSDPRLHRIPVVVLTTSDAESDRLKAYDRYANSYLVKPVDFEKFHRMVKELQMYWLVWNKYPVESPADQAHGSVAAMPLETSL